MRQTAGMRAVSGWSSGSQSSSSNATASRDARSQSCVVLLTEADETCGLLEWISAVTVGRCHSKLGFNAGSSYRLKNLLSGVVAKGAFSDQDVRST